MTGSNQHKWQGITYRLTDDYLTIVKSVGDYGFEKRLARYTKFRVPALDLGLPVKTLADLPADIVALHGDGRIDDQRTGSR